MIFKLGAIILFILCLLGGLLIGTAVRVEPGVDVCADWFTPEPGRDVIQDGLAWYGPDDFRRPE